VADGAPASAESSEIGLPSAATAMRGSSDESEPRNIKI
jgi:hypothetical protein